MDNNYLISPFEEYCNEIDEENQMWSKADYYAFAKSLYNSTPNYITNLFLADAEFRAKNMLNMILSIEGQQGCGKSLFGLALAFYISKIFGVIFSFLHIFVQINDLDDSLRDSPNRTTFILDEQKKKKVGLESETDYLSLIDYEEQCRYTQKNLIYISPNIVDHSHYFVFSYDFLTRLDNKSCYNDSNSKKTHLCKKGFNINKCYSEKWKTLCKIPFHKRKGYPSKFRFLLQTHRKIDKFLVPRGFVEIPIVNPETVKRYDAVKKSNINALEKKQDSTFDRYKKNVETFWNLHKKGTMILVKKVRNKKVKIQNKDGTVRLTPVQTVDKYYKSQSNSIIEVMLYEFLGSSQNFTTKSIKIMVAMIKQRADLRTQKANEKLK